MGEAVATLPDDAAEGKGRRIGRPSSYSPAIAAAICGRIAEGETLSAICREPGMPDRATVIRWQRDKDGFRGEYLRARAEAPHAWADEIVDEARGVTAETAPAVRVRIHALMWIAGRMMPKVYGDRVQVDQGDGRAAAELSDDELAAIAARGGAGTAGSEAGEV